MKTVIEARSEGVTPEGDPQRDPLCGYCGRPVVDGGMAGNGGWVYHAKCVQPPDDSKIDCTRIDARLGALEAVVKAELDVILAALHAVLAAQTKRLDDSPANTKPPSAWEELERRLAAVEIAVSAQSMGTVEHVEGFQWAQPPAARRDAPDLAALKASVRAAALEYTKSEKQAVTSQGYTESV